MRIFTTLGSAAVASALVAGVVVVPAADAAPSAASARHSLVRTCTFDGPKHTPLRIKLRLPLRAKGDNDLRAVKVRATDNRRVKAGQIFISVENENESSNGGSIGSASAVRRHGSPATWRLNPRSNGSEVERVVAEVTFKFRHGPRVVASCAARP
jgi:hypothetical protein